MEKMHRLCCVLKIVCVLLHSSWGQKQWMTTDELENHISPDDLREFLNMHNNDSTAKPPLTNTDDADAEDTTEKPVPEIVDCFGLGSFTNQLTWIFNMKPDTSAKINTHFFFSSRQMPYRVQVYPGEQFGLEWVDFKPSRKTVMIVHGFMSHSNSSWVHDMTRAFLQWADVNVIAVDWSDGGNTWKYWRAVANTRRVGSDITDFLRQLKIASGVRFKDFHFVGHSLGAHIASYVSYHLGGVARITGLDPAQPCFRTLNRTERLDETDADFVDVIHTNGRLLQRIGFGLPEPAGHADFYPNGGMKQPGCHNDTNSVWARLLPFSPAKLQQAICSHGRAYLLFTESLLSNNCSFRAHRWNLTYEGVNSSLIAVCDRLGSCAEMGIKAVGGEGLMRASGPYFVLTTEKEPYCPTEWERQHPRADLLRDLQKGFRLDRSTKSTTAATPAYGDPMVADPLVQNLPTTTHKSWFRRIFWILIVMISAGCLYLLLEPVVQRGDQVNFTPDTRYLQWETTFPAVTVCEIYNAKMTQRKFAALYPDLMEPLNYDFRKYLTELVYGRGSCGKSVCVPCGDQVPCDVPWRTIIEKVHKKCTELITDCRFNNITFDCCQKFRLVDSEYGYCFSFNTLQSEKSCEEPLYIVNITTGPGLLTFRLLYEAQISVHSPEELSTNTLDVKFKFDVKPNLYNRADFLFSIVEMENDPVLSAENTDVRGCRYLEEVPDEALHTYPVYSYGACRLAEDTEHMFDHCGCVHPARDSSYKDHYCNFTGMNCMIVAEVQKQKLGVDDHEDDDGECLPSCVESELTTIHISRRWVHEEPYQGTLVSVRMAALPTLRYKRNLIRTDLDFVVTIGGMVSLFFAASLLSIAEIFYLILRPQKL